MDVGLKIRVKYRDENVSIETLESEYSDFKEKYPKLFEMICSESCNDRLLEKVMKMRSEVECGKTTEEKSAVIMGEILAREYIPEEILNTRHK